MGVDEATQRLALTACNDAKLDLAMGVMSRDQIRMVGVVGATVAVFRKTEEPYDEYLDRVIKALKESVEANKENNHEAFNGFHMINPTWSCHIVGVHFHGEEPDLFFRPRRGEHWKVNDECRHVVGHNGESIHCQSHNIGEPV